MSAHSPIPAAAKAPNGIASRREEDDGRDGVRDRQDDRVAREERGEAPERQEGVDAFRDGGAERDLERGLEAAVHAVRDDEDRDGPGEGQRSDEREHQRHEADRDEGHPLLGLP